jgi:hypothetical protein
VIVNDAILGCVHQPDRDADKAGIQIGCREGELTRCHLDYAGAQPALCVRKIGRGLQQNETRKSGYQSCC